MIEVHVSTDRAGNKAITERYAIEADSTILAASEGGGEVGFVALKMRYSPLEAAAELLALESVDDAVGELLVRAAVSYAERRGAETVRARAGLPETPLKRAGLGLNDGAMSVQVCNVVHLCPSCAEKGK